MSKIDEHMDCRSGLPEFLGANIRYLRKRKGWSQEELARQARLTRGRIASYENGCAEPPLQSLFSIAEVLGTSVVDLVCRNLQQQAIESPNGTGLSFSSIFKNEKRIQALLEEALTLETIIDSLFKCHCYKIENHHDGSISVDALRHDFEQLHQMSCRLLHIHKEIMRLMSVQSQQESLEKP